MKQLLQVQSLVLSASFIFSACNQVSDMSNRVAPPFVSNSVDMMTNPDAGLVPEQMVDAGTTTQASETDLTRLLDTIVNETCAAVYRCCDEDDKRQFWNPLATHPTLEEQFASRLPPRAIIPRDECPVILKEIYEIRPFGPWIEASRANEVIYNEAAAKTCLAELRAAECGEPITSKLFDGTCFAFSPPYGGNDQRKVFTRMKKEGETCTPLADGVGGQFYGTCDPSESFCCVPSPNNTSECTISSTGTGVCRAASQAGETCGLVPQLQLCVSGLECDSAVSECMESSYTPLSLGSHCYDSIRFTLLGSCVDSYCDIFGTQNCETMKKVGEQCTAAEQCVSNECEAGQCVEYSFCAMPE